MSENPEAGSLSKRNAVAFIGEIFATPNLRIGYAYDYTLSNLGKFNTGSHEIMLLFDLNKMSHEQASNKKAYHGKQRRNLQI